MRYSCGLLRSVPCGRSLLAFVLLLSAVGCSGPRLHLPIRPSLGAWPTERGSADNRGSVSGSIGEMRLLWRTRTGGLAAGEPTVSGGVLYFPGLDRRLEIVSIADGRRLWRTRFRGPVTAAVARADGFDVLTDQDELRYLIFHRDPLRLAASFPVIACRAAPRLINDSLILLAAYNGSIACRTRGGDLVWETHTLGPILTAPALVDSVAYVASGRQVIALSTTDGTILWTHRSSGAIGAAPAVGNLVYVGSADSLVYALDRRNGAMAWFFAAGAGVFTTPAVGGDRLFFGANDGYIYALNESTGRLLWRYNTGAIANLPCTLVGNSVLVSSRNNRLLVLDAADGRLIGEHKLLAPATTPPIVAAGRVFVADTKRNLYCFGSVRDSLKNP
ncbi:MAG: PQQ-binding-like beta-propeller repeat protein [Candidatus Zixiibacteriota bacterium]